MPNPLPPYTVQTKDPLSRRVALRVGAKVGTAVGGVLGFTCQVVDC